MWKYNEDKLIPIYSVNTWILVVIDYDVIRRREYCFNSQGKFNLVAREDSMNNESTGNLIMCVKVSLRKQSFGVWEKEYKDSH